MSGRSPRKSIRRDTRAMSDPAVQRLPHVVPGRVLSHGSDDGHDRFGRWRHMALRRHYLGLAMDRLVTRFVIGFSVMAIWGVMGWTIWKVGSRMIG